MHIKALTISLIVLSMFGCSSAYKKERELLLEQRKQEEIKSKEIARAKSVERLKFIRSQKPDSGFNPSNVAEVESLFHLMSAIQDGNLTSKQL
jgi:hypothetical protein